MGEVVDMTLDGVLCEGCAVFMNANPPGHPVRCPDCAKEHQSDTVAAMSSKAEGINTKLRFGGKLTEDEREFVLHSMAVNIGTYLRDTREKKG